MESALRATLEDMKSDFHTRMSAFEANLQKSPVGASGSSDVAAEFAAFRSFITQALGLLQQQIEALAQTVDTMEMQRRRKILLLHGVTEVADENPAQVIVDVVKKHICIADFSVGDIQRCHRMGRPSSSSKPRPILVKLQDTAVRDKIWFSKTKLKGTSITLSEFLTRTRHDIFMAAREKFGVNNSWTREGVVYVINNGIRHRVTSLTLLRQINVEATPKQSPPKKAIAVSRTRRAVTAKK